jgi:peptide/nickel transport system substrate-binding protein
MAKNLAAEAAPVGWPRTLHAKCRAVITVAQNFNRPTFWPTGQILTRHFRNRARTLTFACAIALLAPACGRTPDASRQAGSSRAIRRGGEIVTSVRNEVRSFNRLAARDSTTALIANLTQARLVRINQATQELEPWLAESWTTAPDLRHATLRLRRDAHFSDGHPFTADDVVFTFEAAYDEQAGGAVGDALRVAGKKLTVTAVDPYTVDITFPEPFAPGVWLLDNLPILPRHKLGVALKSGEFAKAWGVSTPLSEIVGLGPFIVTRYVPGQRVVLDRNPRYFRKAPDGGPLPYLDRITIETIPDENSELLRLEAGQLDVMNSEIAPEAYAALKRAADAGRLQLLDLGVGYNANALWFNLKPGAFAGDPRTSWLQRDELRRAISMAVDRKAFADTVFLGAGVPVDGPETEANKLWYWPDLPRSPHDPAAARRLLAGVGLADRNADGLLEDAHGQPARFTLLTQKGRPDLERGGVVIRDELKKIGVTVDLVTADANAVIQAFLSGNYEAVYYSVLKTSLDPALSPDLWFSSGSAHVWNMRQATPATEWERQIDQLMLRQAATADLAERKRLYNEVQKIFVEHAPMIYFVAPRIHVAASSRLLNLTPAVSRPQLLWAADTLAVKGE